MRIPVTHGRDFTDRDDLQSPPVGDRQRNAARDDVARTRTRSASTSKCRRSQDWLTVVGVVGDTKHRSSSEPSQPQLYLAHYQLPMIFTSLVARTKVPPLTLTNDVRRAVWTVDKDQPMWSVCSARHARGATRTGRPVFWRLLLAIFSGVALLLASVGIYGVMSCAVTERTHEIGIRMALGASATRVMGEIVRRGLALTGAALLVGVPAAIGLGRLARGCPVRRVNPATSRRLRAPPCCWA